MLRTVGSKPPVLAAASEDILAGNQSTHVSIVERIVHHAWELVPRRLFADTYYCLARRVHDARTSPVIP